MVVYLPREMPSTKLSKNNNNNVNKILLLNCYLIEFCSSHDRNYLFLRKGRLVIFCTGVKNNACAILVNKVPFKKKAWHHYYENKERTLKRGRRPECYRYR
jgi:hypothetical protein